MVSTLLIAVSLSFDSLAASIASGATVCESRKFFALKLALYFAVFQGLMPVVGWFVGSYMDDYVCSFDHWVAFVLLTILSVKMLHESLSTDKNTENKFFSSTSNYFLITLAIATSIDALIVGITYGILSQPILYPAIIIAIVTFVFSYSGVIFSSWLKVKFNSKIEIVGAIILFLLGLKILITHLISE